MFVAGDEAALVGGMMEKSRCFSGGADADGCVSVSCCVYFSSRLVMFVSVECCSSGNEAALDSARGERRDKDDGANADEAAPMTFLLQLGVPCTGKRAMQNPFWDDPTSPLSFASRQSSASRRFVISM